MDLKRIMMTSSNVTFSALLAIRAGNSPVNSPHKGQWNGALVFSLIGAWMNGWVNNREAGDLRRYRAHHCNDYIESECWPLTIAFRQQVTWGTVDQNLCHHKASSFSNELTQWGLMTSYDTWFSLGHRDTRLKYIACPATPRYPFCLRA